MVGSVGFVRKKVEGGLLEAEVRTCSKAFGKKSFVESEFRE